MDFRGPETLRLEDGQAVFAGRGLQRVRAVGSRIGGAIDRDDIVAARDQRVEDRLAESLLAVDDDTHGDLLLLPDEPQSITRLTVCGGPRSRLDP